MGGEADRHIFLAFNVRNVNDGINNIHIIFMPSVFPGMYAHPWS